MADPVYGPGGSGYYTDPATGQRVWQTRTAYGPEGYQATDPSVLVYDPSNVSTTGSGTPTTGITYTPSGGASNGLTADQQSAKAILAGTLGQYGLGGLADRAWSLYLAGEPIEQVMLDIRASDEYKQRFPAMQALASKGHAISESQYIDLERQYESNGRQFNLPDQFVKQHITDWISGEASPDEIKQRLGLYQTEMYQRPPEVRAALQREYGLSDGDILALVIDESKALPIIQQQFLASENMAASQLSGYGALTRREAEQLGAQGVNFDQASQGFDQLAQEKELFQPIIGETGGDVVTRDDQLGAAFGGNTAAARRVARTAALRKAQFAGGGGFAETSGGITGLGSAAS